MTPKIHYLRSGKRLTACGRKAKKTAKDTRDPERVSCRVCAMALDSWRRACAELT